jgi:Tol biopolymer transport system component
MVYDANNDIWIRDLQRGVSSRFTFGQSTSVDPVWSPDGRRILYTNRQKGPGDLYVRDASGTKDPEPLLVNGDEKYVSDWSSDGKYILYSARGGTNRGWDLWALPMATASADRTPIPLVRTQFNELWATFSPDGKYIAYQSNESGRPEIYVQEFPEARSKVQISTAGGVEAYWRGDGKELFYRSGTHIMAVSIQPGPTFTAGTPAPLFEVRFPASVARGFYRVAPDGQRFLVLSAPAAQLDQPATVVLNWTSTLRR